MKRKSKAVAVAAAAAFAVAIATAAVMLKRTARSEPKTTDNHIVGDKVLEMLFCIPAMNCRAMWSAPSIGTAASAASSFAFFGEEAT